MANRATKTSGGLQKSDLFRDKKGRIRSKTKRDLFFKNPALVGWNEAMKKAKDLLKLEGFVPCKKGTPLHKTTRAIYDAAR